MNTWVLPVDRLNTIHEVASCTPKTLLYLIQWDNYTKAMIFSSPKLS